MKPFRWNHDKNKQLNAERGVTFERIVLAIEAGDLVDILQLTDANKYPKQQILVVILENYVYLVPFVDEVDYYFLKTIIPSRKATRDYLKGGDRA